MRDDITELLVAYRGGEKEAFEELVPLVYHELRRIAHRQLAHHRRGATLDTTALVHEAYLKLVDQTRGTPTDRGHFFALSARIMRQVIVDYARRRTAKKRGGGNVALTLDRVQVPVDEQAEQLLAINTALDRLTQLKRALDSSLRVSILRGPYRAGDGRRPRPLAANRPTRLDEEQGLAAHGARTELGAPTQAHLFGDPPKRRKPQDESWGLLKLIPGGDLLSHAVAHAVPSALRGLTSVFGMGTGVTPSLWPPKNLVLSKRQTHQPGDGIAMVVHTVARTRREDRV